MNQDSLNKFINSRLCFFLFSSVAIIFSFCISRSGELSATGTDGLFFESPDKWLAPGILSWAVNALLIGAVGLVVFLLNKVFAFIREYTIAYITMFLLSTFANPATSLSLNSSAVMAVILFGCTFVLFGNFQRPDKRSAVFLITLLLVAGSFFSYTHLMFIPLFAFGFMQMQIFSFKGFLAILAGIAVPLVIATAFGIIDLPAISWPYAGYPDSTTKSLFSSISFVHLLYTAVLGTVFGLSNILTLMSYRQQLRAYNGFLNMLAVATLACLAFDPQNASTYIVTVNALTAIQAAHFFTIHKFRRPYLPIAAIMIVDIALSVADAFNLLEL